MHCDVRADGTPYVSQQDFRAPIHLSKSHVDNGFLVQSIVNPTAGFFDSDLLDVSVKVGPFAKLVLSTPSASRVYRSRNGNGTKVTQNFQVSEDAVFEWIPEAFIPHAGAKYHQSTRIFLHESASLLYVDWIAPGRVAMGEIFVYDKLRWEFDLLMCGNLLARERFTIAPDDDSLAALKMKFAAAHFITVYAAGLFTQSWPEELLDQFNQEDCYFGHGPVGNGVFVIRALCRDSLAARRTIETLRKLLYHSAGATPPHLGRIFC